MNKSVLALAAVLAVSAAPHALATKQSDKPRTNLKCSPRSRLGRIDGGAVMFRAAPRIYNPDERLWCPAIQWEVNGHKISFHESDCPPFDSVPEEERAVWPESEVDEVKMFWFSQKGEYTIVAKFQKSDDTIASAECKVSVQ